MNERLLSCLLLLILTASFGCTKNPDIKETEIKQGIYSLSNVVYFDAPRLYTKQGSITDTNVISRALTDFVTGTKWADTYGDFSLDSVRYDFELNAGVKTLERPLSNSSLRILSTQTAMLINFPAIKDTIICDIVANGNGTYTLINRDSSLHSDNGCNQMELELLDTAGFRKFRISSANDNYTFYMGRDKFLIDLENGQINLHASTLLLYSSKYCWGIIRNALKIYFPPDVSKMKLGDTVLIQNKRFVYKTQ